MLIFHTIVTTILYNLKHSHNYIYQIYNKFLKLKIMKIDYLFVNILENTSLFIDIKINLRVLIY